MFSKKIYYITTFICINKIIIVFSIIIIDIALCNLKIICYTGAQISSSTRGCYRSKNNVEIVKTHLTQATSRQILRARNFCRMILSFWIRVYFHGACHRSNSRRVVGGVQAPEAVAEVILIRMKSS